MAASIESLLTRPDLWRAGDRHATTPVIASGHRELDAALPGGGWPLQALTEVCHARPGLGELSLMLPAFARAMDDKRWLLFVSAPHLPYAPALADAGIDLERFAHLRCATSEQALWAAEQALRSGVCGALALWLGHAETNALRIERDLPNMLIPGSGSQRRQSLFRRRRKLDDAGALCKRGYLRYADAELEYGIALCAPRLCAGRERREQGVVCRRL